MRFFRFFVRLCGASALFLLFFSYLGALHPVGDSLAVFRIYIAYGVAAGSLVAFLARLWVLGSACVLAAAVAVLHIASFSQLYTPTPPSTPQIIIYSKNLAVSRTNWDALISDVTRSGADVVLLQEVTQQRMGELAALFPDHPHQHICNFSGWSAMAVVSRWPLSDGGCTRYRSLAYAVVDAPSGPVWVASVHQVWPFPHEQAELLPDILAAIPEAPMRQVIAGDFNMVPWGHSVRAISQAGGTHRISPVLPTIEVRGLGLPIDHVLTNGQGTATRAERLSSDHFGLIAQIAWE